MSRYCTKNAYSPVNRTHGIGAQTTALRPNRPVGEQDSPTRRKTKRKQSKKKGSRETRYVQPKKKWRSTNSEKQKSESTKLPDTHKQPCKQPLDRTLPMKTQRVTIDEIQQRIHRELIRQYQL